MTEKSELHPDLKGLVLEAFRVAARQGKPEWHRMRGTVLKNRMLDLTGRKFDEADYGADRFGALVEQLDELLAVDHSAKPFLVELREPYRSHVAPLEGISEPSGRSRIRADLWHAIVDYSDTDGWVWDQTLSKAVPADEAGATSDAYRLPTLDRPALQEWRAEFVEQHLAELGGQTALDLKDWASRGLGTAALPKPLRELWNIWIRDRVHDRLVQFFNSNGLQPPRDLVVRGRQPKSTDELRAFVLRCIAQMSESDLKELPIPAEIAMRVSR